MIERVVSDGVIQTQPDMKTYHFHVSGTADVDDLTPPTGKRIRIYSISNYDISITVQTNSTVGATLSFGTGGMSDHNKIIASGRQDNVGEGVGGGANSVLLTGEVNEVVRLTNMTYTTGTATTMIDIYYSIV